MQHCLIIVVGVFFVFQNISAQGNLARVSDIQKTFYIAEASSLYANFVNPAGLSLNTDDDGLVLGYDFTDLNKQGNSLLSLSMGNLGFFYQDIYNYNDIRLQNYALNISVGGKFLSIGTTNRLISTSINGNSLDFSVDLGIIIKPVSLLSVAFMARNLNDPDIDGLDFGRSYTIGAGVYLYNDLLNIFAEFDFKEKTEINKSVAGAAGLVTSPVNFLEIRLGIYRNHVEKYEGFISFGFLIQNSLRVLGSLRYNDTIERSRYSIIVSLPLKTARF